MYSIVLTGTFSTGNGFCHQKSLTSLYPRARLPTMAQAAVPLARDRLTDAAVARLLSVSKRTLLRWLKQGVIDPPALAVGKRPQRRWAEYEVSQILEHMKRGDLGDSTGNFQSTRRGGEDNHRRYFGKVLRRQRQESAAD